LDQRWETETDSNVTSIRNTLYVSYYTIRSFTTTVSQHNSVTTQQCHNTTVSRLKICDFSG